MTQEPQPVRQDMNAFKKHVNHTLHINSQLASNDSTWPLATFVASLCTSGSAPSPEQSSLPVSPSPSQDTELSPTGHGCGLGLKAPQPCNSPQPHAFTPGLNLVLTPVPASTWMHSTIHKVKMQGESPGEFSRCLCSETFGSASISQCL